MKLSIATALLSLLLGPTASSAFLSPNSHQSKQQSRIILNGADEFVFQAKSAAEKFSGGPVDPSVDFNDYNLSSEQAETEWTATSISNSVSKPDGVYLEPRSNALVYYDVVTVPIARQAGQGIGIELYEMVGGRDDGVGITLVSGLVKGSVSEHCGLVPGDSIIKMAIVKGAMEVELAAIDTECKSWDRTVELIGTLPAANDNNNNEELLQVTVKRLRRKPTVKVVVQYNQDDPSKTTTLELFAGENLRQGMLKQGVNNLNDKYAKAYKAGDGAGDCGSEGGCGLCSIAVTEGLELLNEPLDDEVAELKEQQSSDSDSCRLSCRTIVGYGMKEGTLKVQLK